jgi:hypothetical protein
MRKTLLKSARRRNPVDGMDKPPACPPRPPAEQKQKKRTFNVLPKPDNLIRYRQAQWLTEKGRLEGRPVARLDA